MAALGTGWLSEGAARRAALCPFSPADVHNRRLRESCAALHNAANPRLGAGAGFAQTPPPGGERRLGSLVSLIFGKTNYIEAQYKQPAS